jgi:hypothetical protein
MSDLRFSKLFSVISGRLIINLLKKMVLLQSSNNNFSELPQAIISSSLLIKIKKGKILLN